jgi:hypothetical protein
MPTHVLADEVDYCLFSRIVYLLWACKVSTNMSFIVHSKTVDMLICEVGVNRRHRTARRP